jgi:hypothetical protein
VRSADNDEGVCFLSQQDVEKSVKCGVYPCEPRPDVREKEHIAPYYRSGIYVSGIDCTSNRIFLAQKLSLYKMTRFVVL